jgi:hypothetical protein
MAKQAKKAAPAAKAIKSQPNLHVHLHTQVAAKPKPAGATPRRKTPVAKAPTSKSAGGIGEYLAAVAIVAAICFGVWYSGQGTSNNVPPPKNQQTSASGPAVDLSKNPCDDGYQWYPSRNECFEKHAPKFVEKAKCIPGKKIRVQDTTSNRPGAFRELTCGYVKDARK